MINHLVSAENSNHAGRSREVLPFRDTYSDSESIPIRSVPDIVIARARGAAMAVASSCSTTQSMLVATVVSELARNIILHAGQGEIALALTKKDLLSGLTITAVDHGPGIQNIELALVNGYSSSGGLGFGLPGVQELVDEFYISSSPDQGTRVVATLWFLMPKQGSGIK